MSSVKRTFSLDAEVDSFLSKQDNRSKLVNDIIKRYMAELEQAHMIKAYQAMHTDEAKAAFSEWESATISDGLEEG
jgi:metal-responsive CopG/Arc/MetJ family transcriptional regulator